MPALNAVVRGSSFRSVDTGVNPIAFDAGNASTRKLPQGNLVKSLTLRLTGNLTVSAGPATLVGNESPLALIQRIEIVTDTNRTLWSASGRDIFRYAHHMLGKEGELVAPALTTGTNAFAATIRIPIEGIRQVKPVECYYNTRRYQETNLRITWGTAASIASGGGTLGITACQIDIIAATTTTGFGLQKFDKIITSQVIPITATNVSLDQLVPKNGHLARILLRATRDGATVDDIVNRVSLVADTSYRMRDALLWRVLQQKNQQDYQLDSISPQGAAPTANNNHILGYGFLDLIEDGLFSSAINTFDLNELLLRFDVTSGAGTQLLTVTYEFFEPLKEVLEAGAIPAE